MDIHNLLIFLFLCVQPGRRDAVRAFIISDKFPGAHIGGRGEILSGDPDGSSESPDRLTKQPRGIPVAVL
jgi:hypothetical protein